MNRDEYFESLKADLANDPRSERLIEELREHLDDHESLSMIIGKKTESAESILGPTTIVAEAHNAARRTSSPLMILIEAAAFGIIGTPFIFVFFIIVITRILTVDSVTPAIAFGISMLCMLSSVIFHIFALRTTEKVHEHTQIRSTAKFIITGLPILTSIVFVTTFGLGTDAGESVFSSLFTAVVLFALGAPIAQWILRRITVADKNTRFGQLVLWYRKHILPHFGTILGAGMTVYILITHYVMSLGDVGLDRYGTFIDAHPILGMLIAAPQGILELVFMFLHFWFVDGLYRLIGVNITILYALFFGIIGYVTIITPIFASYQRHKITHRFNIPWIAIMSIVYFGGIALTAPLDVPKITWHTPHYDLAEKLECQELGPMYSTVKYLNRLEGWYSKYFAYRYGDDLVVTMNNREMKIVIDDINNPTITTIGTEERSHGFILLDSPPENVTCSGKSFTYSGTEVYLDDQQQISYSCSSLAVDGVVIAEIDNAQYAGMTQTADGKYAFLLLTKDVYGPSFGYLVELPRKE